MDKRTGVLHIPTPQKLSEWHPTHVVGAWSIGVGGLSGVKRTCAHCGLSQWMLLGGTYSAVTESKGVREICAGYKSNGVTDDTI